MTFFFVSSFLQSLNLGKLSSAETIRVNLPKNEFNAYNLLPETAYCSALDINCSDSEPRFPWQRDAATQCDLDELYKRNHSPGPKFSYDHSKKGKQGNTTTITTPPGTTTTNLIPEKKHSGLSTLTNNLRFWKSSSPLSSTGEVEKKPSTRKRLTRSVLHRAASFDSKGYSRLIQQASIDSPTVPSSSNHLYVPATPSSKQNEPITPQADSEDRNEIKFTFGSIQTGSSSAPHSRASSPPNGVTEPDGIKAGKSKVPRVLFFVPTKLRRHDINQVLCQLSVVILS